MEQNEIKEILTLGENDTVEFKQKASSNRNLAVLMSSFGNSYGGKILIGITNKSKVRGAENPQQVISRIHEALKIVTPALLVKTEIVEIYNKKIVVVNIPPSDSAPHAVEGAYYQRKGKFASIASPKRLEKIIIDRAQESKDSQEVLKEQIHQLLVQNSELAQRFNRVYSWKSKIINCAIGACIGGTVSILIQFIL